ncbi:MAG: N,N-dimethylformamidase beta subunit family domain-containing protein, partial [bacterium]
MSLRRHFVSQLFITSCLFISHCVTTIAQEPPGLFVEGYAWPLSVAPGEQVGLHVSTLAATVSYEIVRLGSENQPMKLGSAGSSASFTSPGKAYPIPEKASSEGCNWPAAATINIPKNWPSGYYEVRMSVQDTGGGFTHRGRRTASSTCYFVVRSAQPGQTSKILLQLATNTYNAYNNWGGFSLYAYNCGGGNQGNKVSFLRPPASQFTNWELPLVVWAEKNGFTLDFATNEDLEFRPEILKNYKLILSVGHDEYWSA